MSLRTCRRLAMILFTDPDMADLPHQKHTAKTTKECHSSDIRVYGTLCGLFEKRQLENIWTGGTFKMTRELLGDLWATPMTYPSPPTSIPSRRGYMIWTGVWKWKRYNGFPHPPLYFRHSKHNYKWYLSTWWNMKLYAEKDEYRFQASAPK
jgi:hypothetical protein